jgi:hypothetical protein
VYGLPAQYEYRHYVQYIKVWQIIFHLRGF